MRPRPTNAAATRDAAGVSFDEPDSTLNLLSALSAGIDISQINKFQNEASSGAVIERYILISTGEAIVGNIGGFDSSVEITALGSPVNFLSRVDELTKHPHVKQLLSSGDLVLCESTRNKLVTRGIDLDMTMIDLTELNLSIRNFNDERALFSLSPSDENIETISNSLADLDGHLIRTWNERTGEAA